MARYTRYRKYSRRYRRSGRWSTRLQNFSGSQLATTGSDFIIYQNLTQNPAQSDDTVSLKYTVKNVNYQVQLEEQSDTTLTNVSGIENLQIYIMFVPQGFIPTGTPSAYANIPFEHPEWIMAHRFYGSATADQVTAGFPPLRLSSRLARKLDTGDRIVAIILGKNTSSTSKTLFYQGLCKYYTKAN